MEATVSPAYGRDYKNADAARTDWLGGKDFWLEAIDGKPYGTYCSQRDFPNAEINLRYNKKRSKLLISMREVI